MTLAERLKQARTKAELTQEELATRSGVSQQMISKLESGKSRESADIVKLAMACGVRPEWLAEAQGDPYLNYPAMQQTQAIHIKEENPRIRSWVALYHGLTLKQQDAYIQQIEATVQTNKEIAAALAKPQA